MTKTARTETKKSKSSPSKTFARNVILAIEPYKLDCGLWAFDDSRFGLKQELFMEEASAAIDALLKRKQVRAKRFTLVFSDCMFPKYDAEFTKQERILLNNNESVFGTWYFSPTLNLPVWLCPALLNYFEKAPKKIYIKAIVRN